MRYLPVFVLITLLALAGCSLPGGGAPERTTPSVTPVPVPEQTTTTPGIPSDDQGRFDAWLDAHASALNGTTYAYNLSLTFIENGSIARVTTVYGVVGPDRSNHYTRIQAPDYARGRWANATHLVSFDHRDGERQFDVRRDSTDTGAIGRTILADQLTNIAVENITRTDSGYRVTATFSEAGREAFAMDESAIANSSVWLQVRPDGLIETFHFEWSLIAEVRDYSRVVNHYTFDPSVERVPRPDWVDGVLGNTSVETPHESS